MSARIPDRDEVGLHETLVQVLDGIPDGFNRVRFVAFWRHDYLTPNGVRGQVFHADLGEFTAREERQGHKVRRWPQIKNELLPSTSQQNRRTAA